MIRLKNVSKFYYNKGVIASGFTKVNLEFNIGEFVAITGESGSGKSTLLNVISGLDTYEEGEMYIDGKETSHYLEKDWEAYRRKNIGNIYQNFNLVNSYTVYQNIDLALSLNGIKHRDRKKRILELLGRVDMLRYKNTKVSKLSGGQKQRVAIARALAKDIPVIIADEPTGNLDKRSAENIIKLLREVASDKLVIIVTHNYEQVKDHITRKITMHDGRVIEDVKLRPIQQNIAREEHNYKNISLLQKIRLGIRNTFNIIPKFILLFLVYAFIVGALILEYTYFKIEEYNASKDGMNIVYTDRNDKRIVINKEDRTAFTTEEINNLKQLNNIDYVVENDTSIDENISITDDEQMFWFDGSVANIDTLKGNVSYGRMPKNESEIVVQGFEDDYDLSENRDEFLDRSYYFTDYYGNLKKEKSYKVVGIKYVEPGILVVSNNKIYVGSNTLKDISYQTNQKYSTVTINFMGTNHMVTDYDLNFSLETNKWVSPGTAFVSEDYNIYCDKFKCIDKTFTINAKNIYYETNKTLTIKKTYNKKNISWILNLPKYKKEEFDEFYNGKIYINPDDYNSLFNKGTYQMSIYVKDVQTIKNTNKELKKLGYDTLVVKDTYVTTGVKEVLKIIKLITTIVLVVVLFFISYFIIRLILKSRNTYFAILRMLGANKGVCRELITIELFTISNLSYFIFVILIELNKTDLYSYKLLNNINRYFTFNDYIILYILISCMSLLISMRYSRKLFKDSVMNTYREEV
ncbi:MAG: ABC transporter ATP-binding protein [Bacilli bacterium]|nr:ABC transporter ATP-binding protein [Bacilli bacterium]